MEMPAVSESNTEVLSTPVMISALPDELLSTIFLAVPTDERRLLASVCPHWHRLLLQPGIHWQRLDLSLFYSEDDGLDHLDTLLEWMTLNARCSLTTHLALALTCYEDREEDEDLTWVADDIFQALPALQHLCVELEGQMCDAITVHTLEQIAARCPALQHVSIRAEDGLELNPCLATGMSRLTQLRHLDMDGETLGLPTWLNSLTLLRTLRLELIGSDTGGAGNALGDGLSALARLSSLQLDVQEGGRLAWGTAPLPTSLREFRLSGGGMESAAWAADMWQRLKALPNLESLSFETFPLHIHCHITGVCRLIQLRRLQLRDLVLHELPRDISSLARLTLLDLGSCRIRSGMWSCIAQLSALRRLDLRGTNFDGPTPGDFMLLARLPQLRALVYDAPEVLGDGQPDDDVLAAVEEFNRLSREATACEDAVLPQWESPLRPV